MQESPSPYQSNMQESASPYQSNTQEVPSPYQSIPQEAPSTYQFNTQVVPSPYHSFPQKAPSTYQSNTQEAPSPYQSSTQEVLSPYQSNTQDVPSSYQSSTQEVLSPYQSNTQDVPSPYQSNTQEAPLPYQPKLQESGMELSLTPSPAVPLLAQVMSPQFPSPRTSIFIKKDPQSGKALREQQNQEQLQNQQQQQPLQSQQQYIVPHQQAGKYIMQAPGYMPQYPGYMLQQNAQQGQHQNPVQKQQARLIDCSQQYMQYPHYQQQQQVFQAVRPRSTQPRAATPVVGVQNTSNFPVEISTSAPKPSKRRANGKPYSYPCMLCSKSFTSPSNRLVHMVTAVCTRLAGKVRQVSDSVWECTDCGPGNFDSEEKAQRHALYHLRDKSKMCPVCGVQYLDKHDFVRHMRDIHPEYLKNLGI